MAIDIYESRITNIGGVLIKKERINKTTHVTFSIDGIIFERSGGNITRFCENFTDAIHYLENNGCEYINVVGKCKNDFPVINIIDMNGYSGAIKLTSYKRYIGINEKLSKLCKKNNHRILSFCNGTESEVLIDFNCEHEPRNIRLSYYIANDQCRICSNIEIEKGINDVATTHPEFVKYFKNESDSNNYTYGSGEKVWFKCPCCGFEVERSIGDTIAKGFSCSICNDTLSTGEKLVYSLLFQHNIRFEMHKTFKWSNRREYDFYLLDFNTIIEVHGSQHYNQGFASLGGRTIEEEKENDKLKEELAYANYIERYVIIDARFSDFDFIKNNIIKSILPEILSLKDIIWDEIYDFASTSLMSKTWDIKRKNPKMTTTEISKEIKMDAHTIRRWLKIGDKLNKCYYKPYTEALVTIEENAQKNKRTVLMYRDENLLGEYESASYMEKNSMELFGVFLYSSEIRRVCNGVKKSYKGYTFKYKNKYKYSASINKKTSKKIGLYKNGELLKTYESCQELARKSFNDFGVKLQAGKISEVCNGKRIAHKGFTASYL